jgi:hypothetical protein
MDNRLDFYNNVENFIETLTDETACLVLCHTPTEGDFILAFHGNWEYLSSPFSTMDYVKLNEDNKERYEMTKNFILNTAFNICNSNNEIKESFIKSLQEL